MSNVIKNTAKVQQQQQQQKLEKVTSNEIDKSNDLVRLWIKFLRIRLFATVDAIFNAMFTLYQKAIRAETERFPI